MKRQKEQWKPRVSCFLKDGTPVKAEEVRIPDDHPIYAVLARINRERIERMAYEEEIEKGA